MRRKETARILIRRMGVLALMLAAVLGNAACSTNRQYTISDPYEEQNRILLDSALAADAAIVQPGAKFYNDRVNNYVQRGVRNFIENIETSNAIVNDLLQVRFHRFFHDSARLLINSTAGLLGLIDVAAYLDLQGERNDFGKTLAIWGWSNSSMLIVPFFGTTTVRDLYGFIFGYAFVHPRRFLNFNAPEALLYEIFRGLNARIDLLPADALINDPSVIDQYAFIRQYYRQSRIVFIERRGDVSETKVIWSDEDLELLD